MSPERDVHDAPAWIADVDNPYLHGIHAPTAFEQTAHDLPVVEGELPEDLYGTYVRNGPNALMTPSNLYHWFDGDGMLHAVHFEGGQAHYRNRFIQTTGLKSEASAGRALWPGPKRGPPSSVLANELHGVGDDVQVHVEGP